MPRQGSFLFRPQGSILFCPKGSVPRAPRGQTHAPFPEAGFDNLDILVQFEVSARASFRHGALLVPVFRDDTATDVHFRYLPADGYADKDWILAVAEGAGFPCYERQGEIRIM